MGFLLFSSTLLCWLCSSGHVNFVHVQGAMHPSTSHATPSAMLEKAKLYVSAMLGARQRWKSDR